MADEKEARSKASKFGQLIGKAFEKVVVELLNEYLQHNFPQYQLLKPPKGKKQVKLDMLGGTSRQIDSIITSKKSTDPVALLETKWLKDARHHNDKGAWILQLREVFKKYPTIRGAAAILAGYWTEGVGLVLMSEAGIRMVLVATDEEIYGTLQPYLDRLLGADSFIINANQMRKRLQRPSDLEKMMIELKANGELEVIAKSWLEFTRQDPDGHDATGTELIKQTICDFVSPLPEAPTIASFEIALHVETGNVIYQKFDDMEHAIDFIQSHFSNPDLILKKIIPKQASDDDRDNTDS